MISTINIEDYLPATIASRQAMQFVEKNLATLKEKYVVINFQNVDFISRVFADELIHSLSKNRIKAKFINTNPAVNEILKAVKNNRKKRNNTYHKIAVTEIKDKKQLALILSLL